MAVAEQSIARLRGLVLFAFPLHPAGKPGTDRAQHLCDVALPMLFLSGTRDKLAELELLEPVCERLGERTTLRLLDTADHSFRVLKRSRNTDEDVFAEMARVIRDWVTKLDGAG